MADSGYYDFVDDVSIGRLVADPEMSYTSSGKAQVKFKIAVSRGKSPNGEEVTHFWPCIAWGPTAEYISQYIKKGNRVLVRGCKGVRSFKNDNGEWKTYVDYTVEQLKNLSPRENGNGDTYTATPAPAATTTEEDDDPFGDD